MANTPQSTSSDQFTVTGLESGKQYYIRVASFSDSEAARSNDSPWREITTSE